MNESESRAGSGAAMLRGGFGFAIVSLAAFSVWAFGGNLFRNQFGEGELYAACAAVFLGLSGLFLRGLLDGAGKLSRFYSVFIPAFLAYAVVWCVAWFALRFGAGEWLGSLLGSAAFVAVTNWRTGHRQGFFRSSLVLFVLNSAGYFAGEKSMYWILNPENAHVLAGLSKSGVLILGKLAWGLFYGLGFGAGIGYAFHAARGKS